MKIFIALILLWLLFNTCFFLLITHSHRPPVIREKLQPH
jgi:hypothetical protein